MTARKIDRRSSAARAAAKAARGRPALSDEDYRALGEFRLALRRFLAFSEAGARALGLTPQQHQALLAIRSHAGGLPSVGDLAGVLLIKNHSALGLVSRLQDLGLVARQTDAADRRRVVIALTAKGAAVLETISRNNLGELNSASPTLSGLLQTLSRLDRAGLWNAD